MVAKNSNANDDKKAIFNTLSVACLKSSDILAICFSSKRVALNSLSWVSPCTRSKSNFLIPPVVANVVD